MTKSDLYTYANTLIPGGVNSPVRAFSAVGGDPIFIQSAQGAYLQDSQLRQYIDYINGFGPHILGHSHPEVVEAISTTAKQFCSVGACTELEISMAEILVDAFSSVEMVRLVNSGTEGVMSAIRLSRAWRNKPLIMKFSGGYHGHVDAMLVSAGSGALSIGVPSSPGVTASESANTLVAEYNNLASVDELLDHHAEDIAAIIVEPVAGNMGLIEPHPDFLPGLRERATKHNILLIFDEVMTGFRVAYGGAQSIYNVCPDLTVMGKVIGGGLPVGAIGGSKDLMKLFAPTGPVYQAGTLSGNPITVAAGLACLDYCRREQATLYPHLSSYTKQLTQGMQTLANKHSINLEVCSVGGMFGFFFANNPVRNYQDACGTDLAMFKQFFHCCLQRGVYFAPSPYEAGFVSLAHDADTLTHTLNTIDEVFGIMQSVANHAKRETYSTN